MKKFIFVLLFSLFSFAGEGVYIAPTIGFSYGSSGESSLSSMLGNHVGVAGGMRFGSTAFELGIKRIHLTNDSIGNSDFESDIKNDMYYGGVRIFLDESFVLNAGLVSHNLAMNIKNNNGTRLKNREEDGSYLSFYGGAGIQLKMSEKTDFFWEGILFPNSDADFFTIDLTLGLRFYL